MTALPLTWMADAFRENGLRVREVQGWKTAGRPFTFAPVGVVFHHTASNRDRGPAPALGTVTNGRSDLPGPLCNVLVARDSTVYCVAAGYANHAGFGGPFRTVPLDSGNRHLAGVEVENDGIGEPWRDELLDTCAVVFSTFLIGFRRTEDWLIGHKEWAPTRKIDPARLVMDDYRQRVRTAIDAIAHPKKKAPKPAPKPKPKRAPTQPAPETEGRRGAAAVTTGVYVVEAGDTLWKIAHEHRMSVQELRDLNALTGDLIHVGDELRVPARTTATAPVAPLPARPGSSVVAPSEDGLPSEPPVIDEAVLDQPSGTGEAGTTEEPAVAEDQIY